MSPMSRGRRGATQSSTTTSSRWTRARSTSTGTSVETRRTDVCFTFPRLSTAIAFVLACILVTVVLLASSLAMLRWILVRVFCGHWRRPARSEALISRSATGGLSPRSRPSGSRSPGIQSSTRQPSSGSTSTAPRGALKSDTNARCSLNGGSTLLRSTATKHRQGLPKDGERDSGMS